MSVHILLVLVEVLQEPLIEIVEVGDEVLAHGPHLGADGRPPSPQDLLADHDLHETLARATELRVSGQSYAMIAATLAAEGRPTKRGGPWQAISVRSVLMTAKRMTPETDKTKPTGNATEETGENHGR